MHMRYVYILKRTCAFVTYKSTSNTCIYTQNEYKSTQVPFTYQKKLYTPHEKLLGITWVSNPATRKDLAARTWGVFWYKSKIPVLFDIMVQSKQKRGTGVKIPSAKSLCCGVWCMNNVCFVVAAYDLWITCASAMFKSINKECIQTQSYCIQIQINIYRWDVYMYSQQSALPRR